MRIPKFYNIAPAKGQALLNFQGRRFPDKLEVYEAERIEEVRSTNGKNQSLFDKEKKLNSDFTNLLIHGDCLSACAYLKQHNIMADLVYIDPPFASGANYAKKIYLRNGGKSDIEKEDNTIGEEIMYGDIWQKEDYLNWLYERLLAIKEIMSETGSIFVHLDWHIGHYVKILLDEIFGEFLFKNEIIWCYSGGAVPNNRLPNKHDVIYWYTKSPDAWIYNPIYKNYSEKTQKRGRTAVKGENAKLREEGTPITDWWIDVPPVTSPTDPEKQYYNTQKSESLLKRIINLSSDKGMIIADFFSGSGTTAKAANDLKRKFITCDVGINAVQTTRDRLVKSGASFDVLKVQDGLRLFRNPAQTTAKIFSIIDGFKTRAELNLNEFWDGGIAKAVGTYAPVKFSGIHDKLTKELLDVYLEEIYLLEDTANEANEVIIIYAHKEIDIDQKYLNKLLNKTAKTELKVRLVSLDKLLSEKREVLFTPDNADIKITKKDNQYTVEIKRFFSPYLKRKLDEYNAKKINKSKNLTSSIKVSDNGLELIETVQFDTTLGKIWRSNPALEDKAGIKNKIKGVYTLDTDKFKMKIRNIAGDEIIIIPRRNI